MARGIADVRGIVIGLGRNPKYDHIVVDLPESLQDIVLDIAPGRAEGIKLGDEIHVEVWWEPSVETFDTVDEMAKAEAAVERAEREELEPPIPKDRLAGLDTAGSALG